MAYTPAPESTFDIPDQNNRAMIIAPRPTAIDRVSFAKAVTGGIDTNWGTVLKTGSGMTINQTGGNLVITAGTTAYTDTVIRSGHSYSGGVRLRAQTILSQRIANNNFFIELVDVVGDGLAVTINSATSVTVTIPNNTFDSSNIGQSMYMGAYSGTGAFVSSRWPISAVSGNNVTFTVAGFSAGTGTCSLFGWNYYHIVYDGTTATNAKFDTQRRGYNSGDTTATISTTASPGHVGIITANDMQALFSDQLVASATGARNSVRASRDTNVPDDAVVYMQIRVVNGSTAPASSTTWTIGYTSVSNYASQDVVVQDLRQTTNNTPLPVDIQRSVSLTTSTTVTATPASGSAYSLTTAATTNTAVVKSSAGNFYEIAVSNVTASTIYVKLFNKTTAPTLGTDVPVITIPVVAGELKTVEFGAVGKRFATGISIAVTANAVSTDATAITAGAQISATYI